MARAIAIVEDEPSIRANYVEALSRMGSSNNAKVFFLPVEAAGVMASIAGIGELAKEAQSRAADAVPRSRGSVPNAG